MKLFRVQHPEDETGPYCGIDWDGYEDMKDAHNFGDTGSTHPAPWMADSGLKGCRNDEQCACDSPASLLAWFEGFWNGLADAGFEVVVIEPGAFRVGAYGQAVYTTAEATVLDHLPIEKFLKEATSS